jgi:hypothetical protein
MGRNFTRVPPKGGSYRDQEEAIEIKKQSPVVSAFRRNQRQKLLDRQPPRINSDISEPPGNTGENFPPARFKSEPDQIKESGEEDDSYTYLRQGKFCQKSLEEWSFPEDLVLGLFCVIGIRKYRAADCVIEEPVENRGDETSREQLAKFCSLPGRWARGDKDGQSCRGGQGEEIRPDPKAETDR